MVDQVVAPTTPVIASSPAPETTPHSSNKTALYVVLVLVLLALVGAGSYFLGQQSGKQTAQPVPTMAYVPTITPVTPSLDSTANWKTFSSTKDKYSLQYNPSWQITYCESGSLLFLAPTAKALGICQSDFNGQMYVAVVDGDKTSIDSPFGPPNYTNIESKDIQVDGVVGKRTSATYAIDEQYGSPATPQKGDKFVYYRFYSNDKTYSIWYSQAVSGDLSQNVLGDFDLMVQKTFTFTK